eukprot:GHVT01101097.1.p1 GENE.GHVT01101097.1~~GHVT01101097.1.p1  ORF type:complete len:244 (-),score=36.33 GHVT01101097.1:420-1151(-)
MQAASDLNRRLWCVLRDPEPFDWYQRYSNVKSIFEESGLQNQHAILMVGCGNSRLTEEMYDDGYHSILNIDYAASCIKAMEDKYREYEHLSFKQMDATSMTPLDDASFDAAIDKGTMDSILCGEDSVENVKAMLGEVHRILKAGGLYIIISYGSPSSRLNYLQDSSYHWTVTVKTVQKPSAGTSASFARDEKESVHYVYVCRKKQENEPMPATVLDGNAEAAKATGGNEVDDSSSQNEKSSDG